MSGRESAVKQAYRVNVYCILDYIKAGKCGSDGLFSSTRVTETGEGQEGKSLCSPSHMTVTPSMTD